MAAPKRNSRELVYEVIKQQIEAAAGGTRQAVVSMARTAKQVDLSGTTFADHVQKLVEAGRLIRVSATSLGVVLALPAQSAPAPADPKMEMGGGSVSADEARIEATEEVAAAPEAAGAEQAPQGGDAAGEAESSEEDVDDEAPEATGSIPGGSLRDRILEYVKGQIGGAEQEVLLSTKMIADALGTSANNVAYHVGRLAHAGHISTRSAGAQGTRFRLGGAPQVSATTRRRRGAQVSAAGTGSSAPAPLTTPGAKLSMNFCPHCGSKVLGEEWRFCASCGKPLGR